MKPVLDWVIARAKEGSTHAALAALAATIGIAPELFSSVWGLVVAGLTLLGVVLNS